MEEFPKNSEKYTDAKEWFTGTREELSKERQKTQKDYNYAFSQEEIDDTKRRIKEDYRESYLGMGKSEEEFEVFWRLKELEEQKLELERQRLKLEHELTIARQTRERRERIADFENRQRNGEDISGSLLYKIDKELEEELKKTQADYDKEQ